MRHDSLDEFSILFIRHDPLDYFSPCVTILWTKCTSSRRPSMLTVSRGWLNRITSGGCTPFAQVPHHQRQVPSCTLSCGATVVLAQDAWFGRRSDSPVLTLSRLEFSLNEHGVAPTDVKQPNVGL